MRRRPKKVPKTIKEFFDLLLKAIIILVLGYEFADEDEIEEIRNYGLLTDRDIPDRSYLTIAYLIGKYEWKDIRKERLEQAMRRFPRITPEESEDIFRTNATRMVSAIENLIAKLKVELGDKFQREVVDRVVRPSPTEQVRRESEWAQYIDRIEDTLMSAIERTTRAEFHSAHQIGTAMRMLEESRKVGIPPENVKVKVLVRPDACGDCKLHYLNDPSDITSNKVFFLLDLLANGSNAGKPKTLWKPTIPPLHPNCVCMLIQVFD